VSGVLDDVHLAETGCGTRELVGVGVVDEGRRLDALVKRPSPEANRMRASHRSARSIDDRLKISLASRRQVMTSRGVTPYGNEYGLIAVVAETREEAIAKADAVLRATRDNYVPRQRYIAALLDNLESSMKRGHRRGVHRLRLR
jgi:hypothetical protein